MNPMKFLVSVFLIAGGFHTALAAEWIGPDEKVSGKYDTKQLEQLQKQADPAATAPNIAAPRAGVCDEAGIRKTRSVTSA